MINSNDIRKVWDGISTSAKILNGVITVRKPVRQFNATHFYFKKCGTKEKLNYLGTCLWAPFDIFHINTSSN